MKRKLLKRVFEIIEPSRKNDLLSSYFDSFIIILIILSIISVILETINSIALDLANVFALFEVFSIICFSIEYFLRIITCGLKYPSKNFKTSFIQYVTSPMALIDLLAILPFYIPFLIPIDLRFLRILRLTRLLRILKLNRYSKSLQLLSKVLKRTKEELLVTIFVTMILMLLAASIMYYVENASQPESFPNIPASFWWAIATLTTVGYGDVYPITYMGKLLAGIIALLGIGLVALPTGIISSGFMEEFQKNNEKKTVIERKYQNSTTKRKNRKIIALKKKKTS